MCSWLVRLVSKNVIYRVKCLIEKSLICSGFLVIIKMRTENRQLAWLEHRSRRTTFLEFRFLKETIEMILG